MSEARPPVRVRVVVVTWWPGESLAAFLDSLAATTTVRYHVVVADNGGDDGAVAQAAERPEVQVLHTGANLGYGGAANVGAADGDEELVVVANPDVVWHAGALDELVAAAERWPDAGVLGPAILTPQGDLYPSARAFPSISRGAGHALCGWWWPTNPWTRAYRNEHREPEEGPYGWLSGSCMLLRRSAFSAVDGFDTSFFMYFEDLDLCHRLALAGYQSVYVPTAVVEHTGGHATSRVVKAMQREHHRSAYRFLARRHPGPARAPLRLALRGGLAARYALTHVVGGMREGARPTRSKAALGAGRTED